MDASRVSFPPSQPLVHQIAPQSYMSHQQMVPSSAKLTADSSVTPKRKRETATPPPEDSYRVPVGDFQQSSSTTVNKPPKKKKASRACAHCQKAHLTCDDSRPCQRCVKRGMADSCVEGHRKKAKYLLDDDELEALRRSKEAARALTHEEMEQDPLQPHQVDLNNATPMIPDQDVYNLSFDPTYPFGSQTANLEYSILSAILGNPSPNSQPYDISQSPQVSLPPTLNGTPWVQPQQQAQSSASDAVQQPRVYPPNLLRSLAPPSPPHSNGSPDVQTDRTNHPPYQSNGPTPTASNERNAAPSGKITAPGDLVYTAVTSGHDYTQGYHFLMRFLRERFEKNDILRVIRALAIFRPSLIALQMPLSDEDEIFVERALQRSLLELEKLVSFSGTPTAVWRRTGEICVVGLEFSMLTGWNKEELIGHKFIYELFENQSVVEYWENFASHAFENSTQSVYAHCVLLKPSGEPVPCAFCFTIRRDMFDLPNLIIGQWLPLF